MLLKIGDFHKAGFAFLVGKESISETKLFRTRLEYDINFPARVLLKQKSKLSDDY